MNASPYVRGAYLRREKIEHWDSYPFSLPVVRDLDELWFNSPVVFLAGENGAGKSTLLEAIAVAYGLNPEGGSRNLRFSTEASHSRLHEYLTIVREPRRAPDCFFLRAESFYNVATQIDRLEAEKPGLLRSYGGTSLHEQSHGESFFSLFMHRIGGPGFYVLDEPEAALSPMRQMALLTRIRDLALEGAQFLISSHSPILMSYPGALIYWADENGLREIKYEETEHYIVSRSFLNNHKKMQEILWGVAE